MNTNVIYYIYIKHLAYKLRSFIKCWNHVNKCLPKETGSYLCTCYDGFDGYYVKELWFDAYSKNFINYDRYAFISDINIDSYMYNKNTGLYDRPLTRYNTPDLVLTRYVEYWKPLPNPKIKSSRK